MLSFLREKNRCPIFPEKKSGVFSGNVSNVGPSPSEEESCRNSG
ncbi:hypothetical protein THTE_3384 [Thermogutta terrifontis]|uniref:Uncharacterized protein n=1 Tax=Thermogutta terrifontis TaxID=1331910 RepID=A0A286RJ57_9BACT|nr:hypothetical protein THTE_3384 [Thermogutta terrifontis]